jgi:hypothetical protein
MTCAICFDKGYIYYGDKEEYDIELCQCQKEANKDGK